jgi:salicylate hydroxylase
LLYATVVFCVKIWSPPDGVKSRCSAGIHDYEVEMVEYGFAAVRRSMQALEQAVTNNGIGFVARKTIFRLLNAMPPVKRRVFRNFGDV